MSTPRFGLGRKLGAIYAGLGVVIGVALLFATLGLAGVVTDVRRMLEENREARLAGRLVSALDRVSPDSLEPARAAGTLDAALADGHATLVELIEGADPADPSEAEHQSEENALVERIEDDLAAVAAWAAAGVATPVGDELRRRLVESRSLAGRLSREMDDEAGDAAADLVGEIERLHRVFVGSAAVSFSVLLLGFVLVHRNLVRPVRSLREGTRRFGAGELDRRVRVETGDEIGELAREFNAMADKLSHSHRDLEARVEERTRQLLHAARLAGLGTLAAGIAHEVNTPLATIASCAEGLERRARAGTLDRETQLSYLETIVREAFRAREITSDVLAFARKDPGEITLQPVGPSLTDAVRMLDRLFVERGVALEVAIAPDLPPRRLNPSEFRQAVVNLLKNAAEATPRGGTVRLSASHDGRAVTIDVADDGPGVSAEHRDAIFDPFFTTKSAGAGTGLGLALVFGIVERHGGSIAFIDRPGGGALFRIVLPIGIDEASA